MFFLKISGLIPTNKQKEFEQTYRFAVTQIPTNCQSYSVTKDALHEGIYHFTCYWENLESLKSFTQSPTYSMMVGAYTTLGKLFENNRGEMVISAN